MILTSTITECKDCPSLKRLIEKIDCSLYELIRNKKNNEDFATEAYFSVSHFKDLSHYKRIITRRIFNPTYPSKDITAQDLIAQANRLLYGDGECSKCVNCDTFENTTTTTTSTSTTSTTTII